MPLEQLCRACARCCSGAVFTATSLEPSEAQRFGAAELAQPCPHLVDRRCQIYASRPKACSSFLCPLAMALERGELELPQALARLEASTGLPVP